MNIPSHALRDRFADRCRSTVCLYRAPRFSRSFARLIALALAAAGASLASAQVVYDESVLGDLSNSGLTPTVIAVHAGSNFLFGTTGRITATDRDYFTFTIPAGLALNAIFELPGTTSGGVSFLGIQAGPQVTVSTAATTANGLLGWDHYDASMINTDLFPTLQISSLGSAGFGGSLGPGNYSIWIQDFTPGTYSYGFDLRVGTAVPEPATYGIVAVTLLLLLGLRRRYLAK